MQDNRIDFSLKAMIILIRRKSDMEYPLHLNLSFTVWGWLGFGLMVLTGLGAVALVVYALIRRPSSEWDTDSLYIGIGGFILFLITVILYLVLF